MSNEIERYVLKPEEIPDRLKIHAVAKPGHAKPQWGDTRFACECGWYVPDGGTALIHWLKDGHDVVEEKYAGGRWVTIRSVAQWVVLRMREPGESEAHAARRIIEALEVLNKRREQSIADGTGI